MPATLSSPDSPRFRTIFVWPIVLCLFSRGASAQTEEAVSSESGQEPSMSVMSAAVPRMIRIRGTLRDEGGSPLTGNVVIKLSLYKDQKGGEALWQESQIVKSDSNGHYSVLLGATKPEGLPLEIFSSGEARWFGVQPESQVEQPRVLLLSVAYALKAADAETLGGKPLSAFVLAGPSQPSADAAAPSANPTSSVVAVPTTTMPCSAVTSDGLATVDQIAKFTTPCNIENSAIYESGGNVAIGNTAPAGTLDVSGNTFIRGFLRLSATGPATSSQGTNSNPLDLDAQSFNTAIGTGADYIFRWQAEPTGNDSTNTGATLNLLYGIPVSISETGLSINKSGILKFAAGQTFPGTGTITGVAAGTGLTGGGTSGNVNLSLLTTCSMGQILAWTGNTWACSTPASGTLSGTSNGIAYFSAPSTLTSTAAPTNGQILIGSTGNAPTLGTLTAGANISITNSPGSITIASTGGGGTTLPFFVTAGGRTGSKSPASSNVNTLWGILLPYNVTTKQLTYDVAVADNTANLYDVGIFDNSGALVADLSATTGTAFAPSTGFKTLSWAQGSTNLSPGRYYLGFTTNCTSACAQIAAGNAYVSFAINRTVATTIGGALSKSLTPPSDSWGTGSQPTVVIR